MISMWVLTILAFTYSGFAALTILYGQNWVTFTFPGYEVRFLTLGITITLCSLVATHLYARGKIWPVRLLMVLLSLWVALALPDDIFDKAVPQAVWLTPLITFALLDIYWLSLIVVLTIGFVLWLHGDRIIFHNLGTVLISISIGVFLVCARFVSDRALGEARQEKMNAESAKEELAQLNTNLEAKVRARTEDLSRSNQDLQEALEKLQETQTELLQANKVASLGKLVAGLAHELNTPVGNALLACSGLQVESSRMQTTLDQSQIRKADLRAMADAMNEVAALAVRNLERVGSMIESFKGLSPERMSGEIVSFELAELVKNCVSSLQQRSTQAPVRWVVELSGAIPMHSYQDGLARVLLIVLDNALRHGVAHHPEGEIAIHASQPDPHWVKVCISDNGHGISESELHRVFEPLFTTHLADSGHGLGLYIAYNLIRNLLGGQITVSNLAEGGLLVELVLPATAPDRVR